MSRVRTAWDSTARAVRTVFGHRWLAVAAVVVVVACGGVVAAAYGYDRSQNDMIAKGVHVGSIDIGGLSADAARAKLRRAFKVLHRPLVLRYRSERVVVTGKQARLHLNVDGIVSQALDRSRNGLFLTRAWRQLTGGRVQAQLRPHVQYSRAAIRSIVDHLRTKIEKKPVDAQVIPAYDHLTVVGGHPGRAVRASELRWRMRQVLVSRHAKRTLAVPTRVVHPKVTIATLRHQYPSYITVDRGNFTLRVYNHLNLVKSYPIAVGQAGLQTPEGIYHIQDKQVDPSWHVPNSAWAGSLAGQVIPPGPSDPLKARWMGIFNGAGIHGTDETWSIGHAVSHGCVRMLIPDVIDLYDRVSVGTPVYIGD